MNFRFWLCAAAALGAVPRASAQEPVTVAVRALEAPAADSAAAVATRDAIVAALDAEPRIEVENAGQYVVIGGFARAGGTTRLDLRIASVATGTMTPLSFALPDGDGGQALANATGQIVAKVLELAGRT
jgi:hypothetical protein